MDFNKLVFKMDFIINLVVKSIVIIIVSIIMVNYKVSLTLLHLLLRRYLLVLKYRTYHFLNNFFLHLFLYIYRNQIIFKVDLIIFISFYLIEGHGFN